MFADLYACSRLDEVSDGCICPQLARLYCPGSCPNLCDAAAPSLSTANRTVLTPKLFSLVARLRSRLLAEVPGLAPHDVRDITTEPFSNAPVPSVAAAFVSRNELDIIGITVHYDQHHETAVFKTFVAQQHGG